MNDIELIEKTLNSSKPSDLFTTIGNWNKQYIAYSKLIHPDVCTHPKAGDAMAIINQYKTQILSGTKYTDEAGDFHVFDDKIVYVITDTNRSLITKSVANFKKLKSRSDKSSLNFHKYLPQDMVILHDKLTIVLSDRAVPLTLNTLEQVHVNWIFSRMFEFTIWMQQIGMSHMGINPTSVFVVPETHGIIVTTFYHMTQLDSKATTISAKYKMWYPTTLFSKKIAKPDVDLELAKKVAIYLLGDRSAGGTKLKMDKKSNINQEFLTFILTKHSNVISDYEKYRDLLRRNFEMKFYTLKL